MMQQRGISIAVLAGGLWLAAWRLWQPAREAAAALAVPEPLLEVTVVRACTVAAFLACLWLAFVTTLTWLGTSARAGAPIRHWAERLTPEIWRRLLVTMLGTALAASSVGTAQADDASHRRSSTLTGLVLPDRPSAPYVAPSEHADHRGQTEPRRAVVVRTGDSLWSIAKAHCRTGASSHEISREWRRWYGANRHAIGPDPDYLLPGTTLIPPTERSA